MTQFFARGGHAGMPSASCFEQPSSTSFRIMMPTGWWRIFSTPGSRRRPFNLVEPHGVRKTDQAERRAMAKGGGRARSSFSVVCLFRFKPASEKLHLLVTNQHN
ncbi:MAG: hypothetical protein ACLPKB_08540 [Xanthobacteraceae bacterium]